METEEEMIIILDWRLDPPTTHHFAMIYIQLHPLGRRDAHLGHFIYEMTSYQVEQAIFSRELMMNYKPSVITYAAMLRAGEEFNRRVFTDEMREEYCEEEQGGGVPSDCARGEVSEEEYREKKLGEGVSKDGEK